MTGAYVLGSGIVNAGQAPMAEGEPGVSPPPPDECFVVVGSDFVVVGADRVITDCPGDTPVLLADLVAGWALTGGPQQTLDSSGVVSGGPNDGIETGGPISYTDEGAVFDESVPQYLSVADSAPFRIGDNPILVVARVIPAVSAMLGIKTIAGCMSATDDDNWRLFFQQPNQIAGMYVQNSASLPVGQVTEGVPSVLFGWYDGENAVCQSNANDPVSVDVGGPPSSFDSQLFRIGAQTWGSNLAAFNGVIRQLMVWIGPNALTIANNATYRTWLANGGAGRTDAEVAAYTG